MTGLYPHHNGTTGFNNIFPTVSTLPEELKSAGYFVGLAGKNTHVIPSRKKVWDKRVEYQKIGYGRDPELFYKYTKELLQAADKSGKPFFLMLNSHDPHRPFIGS